MNDMTTLSRSRRPMDHFYNKTENKNTINRMMPSKVFYHLKPPPLFLLPPASIRHAMPCASLDWLKGNGLVSIFSHWIILSQEYRHIHTHRQNSLTLTTPSPLHIGQ